MMKKLSFVEISIFGIVLMLGLAGTSAAGPKIAVQEARWDFGAITGPYPVRHEFKIRNDGDESLRIQQVTTSCGCTAVTLKDSTAPPGKEVSIGIVFNAASLGPGGFTEKTIGLASNDFRGAPVTLTIAASLSLQGISGADIEPKWIRVEKGERGRSVRKAVRVTNPSDKAVEVQILETSGAIVQARLGRARIPGRGRTELSLLVNGKELKGPPQETGGHSVTLAVGRERITLPVEIALDPDEIQGSTDRTH